MKISKMLNESFECVKINGILRNLTNDEMKIYKRVKNEFSYKDHSLDAYYIKQMVGD